MYEYHILTIGHFSRNVFWGESESVAYRDAVCTSTLIRGAVNVVVDPSQAPDEMAKTLFNRSGLRPGDIGAVFITHAHGDHYAGIMCFPDAQWFMGETDLKILGSSNNPADRELASKIRPANSGFIPGIDVLDLPGHTPGTAAAVFDSADGRVAVCGDAAMTRDYFRARRGHYNTVDFAAASASIQLLADAADIVVPGHDNYFIKKSYNEPPKI